MYKNIEKWAPLLDFDSTAIPRIDDESLRSECADELETFERTAVTIFELPISSLNKQLMSGITAIRRKYSDTEYRNIRFSIDADKNVSLSRDDKTLTVIIDINSYTSVASIHTPNGDTIYNIETSSLIDNPKPVFQLFDAL